MAEVTLSPIPYNGGSLRPTINRHFCRITDTKFFGIFSQIDPDYVIGSIFTIDNIRAASPVVSQGRSQSIPDFNQLDIFTSMAFRVVRLNDNDILVLRQTTSTQLKLRVVRLTPVTDEMTVVGNEISISIFSGASIYNSNTSAIGFEEVADNIVLLLTSPTSGNKSIDRITWNPGTLTLTLDNAAAFAATGGFITFSKVRNSDKWAFSMNAGSSLHNSTIGRWGVGDPLNSSTPWTTYVPSPATTAGPSLVILPTTDTTMLSLRRRTEWDTYNGSTRVLNDIGFGGSDSQYPINIFARWVSSDFFIFLSSAEIAQVTIPSSTGRGYNVRVVRYTDDTYGDTSTATAGDVLRFNTGFAFEYGTVGTFKFYGNDLILAFGTSATGNNDPFKLGILSPNSA